MGGFRERLWPISPRFRRRAQCQGKPSSICPVLVRLCVGSLSSGQIFHLDGLEMRKFRANIPPRWIGNARKSRKRIEPEIVKALRSVKSIHRNRPRAQVALRNANKQFKAVLSRWETAYTKRTSIAGHRILLELQRNGSSAL